jgi:electron transfer flavoprotein alpha subunit
MSNTLIAEAPVGTVLVLVHHGGAPRKTDLELLTLARRLGDPVAVAPGDPAPSLVEALARYGATAFHAVPHEPGAHLPTVLAQALVALVARTEPVAVLAGTGPVGTEVAARVAVRLDAGILTGAVDVRPSPDGPVVAQSVCGGNWLAQSRVRRGTPVITVRPNAVTPEPAPGSAPASPPVERAAAPRPEPAPRVEARTPKLASGRPELVGAAVVVAGGRGVGSAAGFDLVGRLADALGGAVGASRAATDLSWCAHEFQIGQTGKTVNPQLYVACGISGAVQHRAGMQGSRTIVAVNKDPKAPIFQLADFGVVGDLHAVLPALVEEIEKRKG